jgi:negative regulator of genetic competence, sporulation and motility
VDLILINSTKLKIMLSPSDMTAYSLTCDNIEYDNTESRRAFWDILNVAKRKTGFDAANNRVFIQVYPSKDGGCEMYVTKITEEDETVYFNDNKNISGESTVSIKKKIPEHSDYDVYSFNEFLHLINACRQLILNGYNSSSSIWTDEDIPRYYLAVEKAERNQCVCLDEYGIKHSSTATYTYISEHCRCICKDEAIEKMSLLV